MCKKRLNELLKQAGFSFVEVLVSVVLLSIMVVGVLMMTTTQIKSNSYLKYHTQAIQLAEEGLERYYSLPYDTLTAPEIQVESKDFGQLSGFPQFARRIEVSNYTQEICTITVKVGWKSIKNTTSWSAGNRWPVELSLIRFNRKG